VEELVQAEALTGVAQPRLGDCVEALRDGTAWKARTGQRSSVWSRC